MGTFGKFCFCAVALLYVTVFQVEAGDGTKPVLGRLSFWTQPERAAGFEAVYEAEIAPFLSAYGLEAASEPARAAGVAGVFCRLFRFDTTDEVFATRSKLRGDAAWWRLMQDLNVRLGTGEPGEGLRWNLWVYSEPARPSRVVPAGPGKRTPAGSGRGTWRTYNQADGLTSGAIGTGIEDRKGNLWFGTGGNGVIRYDGQSFARFSVRDGLAHNHVTSILEDREGTLWFATGSFTVGGGGVSRYDGKTWQTFTTRDGLLHDVVWSVAQDREGVLWFGTEGGVGRYDGKAWTGLTVEDGLPYGRVMTVMEDREGVLWFGTAGAARQAGGLARYDGEQMAVFTMKDGLTSNQVWCSFQDRAGDLWFGTLYDGANRYDGRAFRPFRVRDGLGSDDIVSIFQDRTGDLWIGTHNGVSRYDGTRFETFTTEDGLADNIVNTILQDREGHLWFGAGGGLTRYDGRTFVTFTTTDGLPFNIARAVCQDRDGNLWFGSVGYGLCRYDGTEFETFATENCLAHDNIGVILQDRKGDLWVGTVQGLTRYDGETFTTFLSYDFYNIWTALEARDGGLWLGTARGLIRYDGKVFETFGFEDGLPHDMVYALFQDRAGNLWVGTHYGASRYDGERFETFTAQDGLASDNVRVILQDRKGDLWFGTEGGVSRYDGERFETFTTEDGLASNSVRAIVEDREGHLWFGTKGGVNRYDGRVLQTIVQGDGMASNVVRRMIEDRDSQLWITTNSGITRYRRPEPVPPRVAVDAVVANRRYEKVSELSMPSTVGLTVFELRGQSFKTRREAMIFRYRLKGYDANWKTTHERRVEYQDLPRGTYTFEVQAVDRDLVYSEAPAAVVLKVHFPYERAGLLGALGLALGLVVWQTVRVIRRDWKLRAANAALLGANRELEKKTLDLEIASRQVETANRRKSQFLASMSHELRTPMNAIIGFTRLVLRRSGKILPERQRENLAKVLQSSGHLLTLINDILDLSKIEAGRMEVQPGRFDVKKVVLSCCSTVSHLANPGVRLNYAISEEVGEVYTDEVRLRQIVINLLSNALKHTDRGEVKIQVGMNGRADADGTLVISVSDTGRGIPADALELIFEEFKQVKGSDSQRRGTGLGLPMVKQWTRLLGGGVRVESEMGKGSTFTAEVAAVYKM